MFRIRAFYIMMLFAWYDRVDIWFTCWKHLHDNIIQLRVEVWDNTTSLTPPLFIEMPVLSQENDRAVIYQKVIKYMYIKQNKRYSITVDHHTVLLYIYSITVDHHSLWRYIYSITVDHHTVSDCTYTVSQWTITVSDCTYIVSQWIITLSLTVHI
jgi:hypothetical protein